MSSLSKYTDKYIFPRQNSFELAVVDKDVSSSVLLFTGRPASRDGEIRVITSTWAVFLAQMKRLEVGGVCRNHVSITKMKVDSIIPRALRVGHLQKYSRKK